jgi:hypothetical protein
MKDGIVDADALRLAQLGHEQSFERQFSKWTMLGLAFAILNSWTALAASLSLALPSGGPIAVVWVSCWNIKSSRYGSLMYSPGFHYSWNLQSELGS